MGLTGIQIFKLLPKTNCKECGQPTCLAFAMQLAAGKAELSKCPYVSDEAKAQLSEASAPPIRGVVIGTGDNAVKVGEELVMYRHEKTFINPTAIAVAITDAMDDAEVDAKINNLNTVTFERVGLTLEPNLLAVVNASGDAGKFEALVKKAMGATEKGLILCSDNLDALEAGAKAAKGRKALLYAATADNADKVATIAAANEASVVAKGASIEEVSNFTKTIADAGVKEIVLDTGARSIKQVFYDNTMVRRAALKSKNREVGYPTINLVFEMTDDPYKEAMYAAIAIAKYGGIVVMSDVDKERMLPLLVQRLNIYTDPQRPMVVDQGIYPINNPGPDSPVIITTNFALTYFIVSAEVEASRVPTWLLIMDVEGMSVLTAWSAGKFVADAMAPFVVKSGITDKVNHKKIIIPGYVAQLSGEFQEELGDEWEVIIGTREASDLPAFLKEYK
ncbi:MAG: acetyl-CoA decarbonylase/synthase complex subunit gamma [Deltaproteobacteria bacterium]|nr:acetyl-CoA decarbonylase/synthase complex subunit gamma [Candidatus Anaeroferrophillacea bacterium]